MRMEMDKIQGYKKSRGLAVRYIDGWTFTMYESQSHRLVISYNIGEESQR